MSPQEEREREKKKPLFWKKFVDRDHIFTALLTFGEGYHNWHHMFPNDYRNGVRIGDYDPTKWLISSLAYLGLAWDLTSYENNTVEMAKYTMKEKALKTWHSSINWGKTIDTLPVWTWDNFKVCISPVLINRRESQGPFEFLRHVYDIFSLISTLVFYCVVLLALARYVEACEFGIICSLKPTFGGGEHIYRKSA